MTPDEIRELLLDLQGLTLETEELEQAILRKAQERLAQVSETPSSETERYLLQRVIYRAETALGLKSQTN